VADKQPKKKPDDKSSSRKYVAVIGTVVIILIIAGALVYGLSSNSPTSFSTFKAGYNSASRVAIYASAGSNNTGIGSTVGCATALIEGLIGSPSSHRNASTIDFFIMNQTSCVYEHGIGGAVGNYTYNSPGNCINTSKSEPSIFINYSVVNSTVIKPTVLYISGDAQFLSLCGVASEIT
jgi:hypothetical protein